MITPLILGALARPAAAQTQAAPNGRLLTVIVNDFANNDRNRSGGDALARMATDAVAVELATSARF